MIGEKRIRSIVKARPLTRDEIGEIVEKYNSIALLSYKLVVDYPILHVENKYQEKVSLNLLF